MNEKQKALIEELKKVVLDLYRSAGQLDTLIQCIEQMDDKYVQDDNIWMSSIRMQASYREDYKTNKGYDKLDEKEMAIWKQLISATNKEEA